MELFLPTTADLIDNPAPRCACALVLDVSASMSGKPIDELNRGLQQFIGELQADEFASCAVELSVVTFGNGVKTRMPFTPAHKLHEVQQLQASGCTPMGQAVSLAMDELEKRKRAYRESGVSYYQPWLVLMSDGGPTDEWRETAERLRREAEARRIVVLSVGIGNGADLQTLGQFSSRPAKRLEGLRFREFFTWLSRSMSNVSQSVPGTSVPVPPTDSWDSF